MLLKAHSHSDCDCESDFAKNRNCKNGSVTHNLVMTADIAFAFTIAVGEQAPKVKQAE